MTKDSSSDVSPLQEQLEHYRSEWEDLEASVRSSIDDGYDQIRCEWVVRKCREVLSPDNFCVSCGRKLTFKSRSAKAKGYCSTCLRG